MTLAVKHPNSLAKLALMASIGSKGMVGDGFRKNVDARL